MAKVFFDVPIKSKEETYEASYKIETQTIINLLNHSSNEESSFGTKNGI